MHTNRAIASRVLNRFQRIAASPQQEFEQRLMREIESNDDALVGGLEQINASQRRYGYDPYDSVDELRRANPKEFQSMLQSVRTRLQSTLNRVTFGPKGILVYRALTLQDPKALLHKLLSDKVSLGKYWSFTQSRAQPYWGRSKGKTAIVFGEMPPASVDYPETVKANTTLAFSSNEDEITARPGAAVFVTSFLVDGQIVDVEREHRI